MSGREKLGEEKGPMVIWSILYDLLNMVEEISVTQSQNDRVLFYSYYIQNWRQKDPQQLKVAVVKAQQSSARGEPAFCDAHGF